MPSSSEAAKAARRATSRANPVPSPHSAAVAKARNAEREVERLKKIKEETARQRRALDEWRATFER